MSVKKKYMVLIMAGIALCAAIFIMNYNEHKENKTLTVYEVYVERGSAGSGQNGDRSSGAVEETININTATAQELADFLPGIGAVKAESIVAYRDAIGGFESVEELIEVKGIGEATMNMIRDYCRVSDD